VYDALGRFAAAEALRAVCTALCSSSRAADASMPSMDPTHLLLVHYSGGKRVTPKIFWHKDDAPNDGANEHPVVSLSLGRSCLFRLAQVCAGRQISLLVHTP
jgi:alkylated DNA repair dioxygenase AlkB